MKQIKKILSTYKRKVHIDEQEWTYQIEGTWVKGFVKVCSPDRKQKWNLEVRALGKLYDLEGRCFDCEWDDCDGCPPDEVNSMTPAHVKRLIEKRILGRKVDR